MFDCTKSTIETQLARLEWRGLKGIPGSTGLVPNGTHFEPQRAIVRASPDYSPGI